MKEWFKEHIIFIVDMIIMIILIIAFTRVYPILVAEKKACEECNVQILCEHGMLDNPFLCEKSLKERLNVSDILLNNTK